MLERVDRFGRRARVGVAGLAVQEREVILVGRLDGAVALAVDEVEIAVGQPEAVEHVGLDLGAGRAGLPEHALGAEAGRQLKQLQDLLGEIHDTQVMEQTLVYLVQIAAAEKAKHLMELTLEDEAGTGLAIERRRGYRAGLLAVGTRVRERRRSLFEELHRRLAAGDMLSVVDAICKGDACRQGVAN